MDNYDVVIIGAGPAGSTAAKYAALGGAKVLILERDREPGIPVRCGEGVSEKGLSEFIQINKKWISAEIDVAEIHSPNGEKAILRNNGKGYILERRIFDNELTKLATKNGANILTKTDAIGLIFEDNKIVGVKIKHFDKVSEIKCKLVIGADGVESRVGRWAGLKTHLLLSDLHTSMQYTVTNIDIESNKVQFYFGNNLAPGGYAWVFPKSGDSANIGVGIAADKLGNKSAKDYLDKFIKRYFPNAKIHCQICGGIPTANRLERIFADNIMLIGDAARQLNPITGGGIIQGMIAGKIAGEVAALAVKKKKYTADFLEIYQKRWDRKLGNTHKIFYKLKKRLFNMNDARFNRLIEECQNIPENKSGLRIIFLRILRKNPTMALKAAKGFVLGK